MFRAIGCHGPEDDQVAVTQVIDQVHHEVASGCFETLLHVRVRPDDRVEQGLDGHTDVRVGVAD